MSNDIEREAFENAMAGEFGLAKDDGGAYMFREAQAAWRAWQVARAQDMTVPMTRIAEKKLKQMGATVHGALVRNEAGAWAAVSEAGRVMWLDNFEGQAGSAQPEQPRAGAVPEGWKLVPVESTSEMDIEGADADIGVEINRHDAECIWSRMITAAPTAPAVEGGGVPEAQELADKIVDALFERAGYQGRPIYRIQFMAGHLSYEYGCGGFDKGALSMWLAGQFRELLPTHPHNGEQGGVDQELCETLEAARVYVKQAWYRAGDNDTGEEETLNRIDAALENARGDQFEKWFRCGDRLPELRDADWEGCVWYWSPNFKMARLKWQTVREWSFQSQNMPEQYWMPTDIKRPNPPTEREDGLTRPQPPKSKEGV